MRFKHDEMFIIGLKTVLEDRSMTQAELSKLSKKPLSTISSWLRNRTKIKKNDQEILAKALDKTVRELIDSGVNISMGFDKDYFLEQEYIHQKAAAEFSKKFAEEVIENIYDFIPETKEEQEPLLRMLRDITEIRLIDEKAFTKIKRIIKLELDYLKD